MVTLVCCYFSCFSHIILFLYTCNNLIIILSAIPCLLLVTTVIVLTFVPRTSKSI